MSSPRRTSRRTLLAAAAFVAGTGAAAHAQSADDDPAQLVAVMERYAAGLRSSNVEALVALYVADGVYMREDMPAVAGTEALRAAYRQVFATLKVDIAYDIHETEVSGDMGWLRGTSRGRLRVLATGAEGTVSFHQLVVFRRQAGAWRIRCFLYGSDRPGSGMPR